MDEILNIASKEKEYEYLLGVKNAQLNSLMLLTEAINKNARALELFELFRQSIEVHFNLTDIVLLHYREDGVRIYKKVEHDIDIQRYIDEIRSYDLKQAYDITQTKLHKEQGYDKILKVHHKNELLASLLFKGEIKSIDTLKYVRTLTNIIAVAIENKRLFIDHVNQRQYQKEMELARQVQQMLVPSIIPETREIRIATKYIPHSEISGDYYDFINLDKTKVLFCISDVAGKGVPAALLMANIQANLRRLVINMTGLADLVKALNRIIYKNTQGERFVTMFIGIYDVISDTMSYVNAGHNAPIVINRKSDKIVQLDEGCTVLGAIRELKYLEEGEKKIGEESILVMYTDGVTEAKNREGEFFGVKRLVQFLKDHKQVEPKEINETLVAAIHEYREEEPITDDITIFTCQIKPEGIKSQSDVQ